MRLMKYSSPSCHSSRSLAPYIIQEGEGGCIEGKGGRNQPGGQGEKIEEGRERAGSFHRGNCEDGMDVGRGSGRMVTSVGSVGVPRGLRTGLLTSAATTFDHGDNCPGIRSIDHAWNLSRIADIMDRTDGSEGKLADEAKGDIFCDVEMISNQFEGGERGARGQEDGWYSRRGGGRGKGGRNAYGQMRDISSRLIINSIECPLIDIMLLQRDQSWLDDGGCAIGPARIVEFEISRQGPISSPSTLGGKRWFRIHKCV
ncbi:hypothetical protein ALC56_11612 [Trachymyrmex septentrionalis]|uniref:Uncharacterized protein n=1 Tax=Trachymyrmex septentrionalis TaxID=34720 RepID=A0A195F1R4_9HYME|nr:hypothetical protein ALC56_11612 [Trachymyrmex septentrionalis]